MANARTVHFTTSPSAGFTLEGLKQQSADVASRVLQKNHDEHDFVLNDFGFHNHTVHHICTIFALGATPDQIQARYDQDATEQRSPPPRDEAVTKEIYDRAAFFKRLGILDLKQYTPFLFFITDQIEKKGWQNVCNEYIFGDDKFSEVMRMRLSSAFCHAGIHFGFGVEFEQPAIIAEGIAQTACHPDWEDGLWFATAEYSRAHTTPKKSMMDIIYDIQADEKLSNAAHWSDENKIRDGLLVRAKDELVAHAAKWQIYADDDLEAATAEMISTCAYFTGASVRKDKEINFDFYYMHMVNASIFFSAFLRQDWLDRESKADYLTSHGRYGLAIYASRHSPVLYPEEIVNYKARHPGNWQSLFERSCELKDDGHGAKFVRALANGEKQCAPYEGRQGFPMKKPMWLQLAHMVVDAVESPNHAWIRSTGFDEAWKDVPARVPC